MFLGLDIGTTNCKAIIFNENGDALSSAFDEYPINYPRSGLAEQDAELVWQKTENVLSRAIEKSGYPSIKALSISVQGDAIIAVDRNLKPLLPVQLGMDYRAKEQTDRCIKLFGREELYTITGMPPHPLNSLPKILWIKDERPEIFKKTWKFMTYADFILSKLGLKPVIDYTMASRTMAFDIKARTWSDKTLDILSIPKDKLSEPVPSGKITGSISPQLAQKLGINSDISLVTGGHDQTCAALGAGITKPGRGVVSTGTAEVLSTVLPFQEPASEMLPFFYPCYIYTIPEFLFTFALNHNGGIVYQWFRDNLCDYERDRAIKEGIDVYSLINKSFPEGPTNLFVLPHFNGSGTPTCDLQSKGAILGLTLSTTKGEIAKAILEGLTYELKLNIETMESIGIKTHELVAVGGGAKSHEWLQMKADITGRPILSLKNKDAASVGAGILAALATGNITCLDDLVCNFVRYETIFQPDEKKQTTYREKYRIYKHLYNSILKLNRIII